MPGINIDLVNDQSFALSRNTIFKKIAFTSIIEECYNDLNLIKRVLNESLF